MERIYLKHRNDRRFVLSCDLNYNPISEENIGQHAPRHMAFYVNYPGGFIGVYSSAEGPVLFVNEIKKVFSDTSWSVSVQRKAGVNQASLIGLAQSPVEFEYPVVELDPMDPWSEEQFDDFFIWLTIKRHDLELIRMWTERD